MKDLILKEIDGEVETQTNNSDERLTLKKISFVKSFYDGSLTLVKPSLKTKF